MLTYLLYLKAGKYYVGRTKHLKSRLQQHVNGIGSEWTKIYTPISATVLVYNCDEFEEDKQVKIAMNKYGIENVRGGSYCRCILTTSQLMMLYNEIKNATDRCFNCGQEGHYSGTCNLRKVTIFTNPEVTKNPLRNTSRCGICNLIGHNRRTCHKIIRNY